MVGVLSYRDVVKRFGPKVALHGVSLDVQEGEVFGLLGPNGAGKTTLIRIAFDILRPDAGEVRLFGQPLRRELLDQISYLPEERGVYRTAKVRDLMFYIGRLKGLSGKDARRQTKRWLRRVGLESRADDRIEALSKGLTQKVQIAATLMNEPQFCVLDEPFSGLDPVNVALVKELIGERRAKGQTTVLSTHMMHQVEALCDRVALIHRGALMVYGALADIRRQYSGTEVVIRADREPVVDGLADGLAQLGEGRWRAKLANGTAPHRYLEGLHRAGVVVDHFEPIVATMDEIFLRVVGEGNAE